MFIVSLFLKSCSVVKVSKYFHINVPPWGEQNWNCLPTTICSTRKIISYRISPRNNYPPVPVSDCRIWPPLWILLAGIFFTGLPKSCKQLQFTDVSSELLFMLDLPETILPHIFCSPMKKDSKFLRESLWWPCLPGSFCVEGWVRGDWEGVSFIPPKYANEGKSYCQKMRNSLAVKIF